MRTTAREIYAQHYASRGFERLDLFELLVDRFGVGRALYPGSFVHVSPSFAIPSVSYVDSDPRRPRFFADPAVLRMVKQRKRYRGEPEIVFHAGDFAEPLQEEDESFDLLISQWAGFISQACKRYLRVGGVLLANDSRGDTSLASLDPCFQLVAAVTRRAGKHRLSERALDTFFVPRSGKSATRKDIQRTGRGLAQSKSAAAYVWQRMR
jgi:hypothetical protein